jgi:hypothetical protein
MVAPVHSVKVTLKVTAAFQYSTVQYLWEGIPNLGTSQRASGSSGCPEGPSIVP